MDPITSLMDAGTKFESKAMVTRLVDYLKAQLITSLFVSLTQGGHALQQSEAAMSSLMDSWLLLQDFQGNGERNRVLYVLKARGMAHSNQVREFLISYRGVDLVDAYIGPSGVLTGSARAAQDALEKAEPWPRSRRPPAASGNWSASGGPRAPDQRPALRLRNRGAWNCGASTSRFGPRRACSPPSGPSSGRLRQADISAVAGARNGTVNRRGA